MGLSMGTMARLVCVASLGKSTLWMERTSMTTQAVGYKVHPFDL